MSRDPGHRDNSDDASDTASACFDWDEDSSTEDETRTVQSGLPSLPSELLQEFLAPLITNRDIKHLRATCAQLSVKLLPSLRFPRIFISPARTNIDAFNAVCAHSIFRHKVEEIVWDAALLEMPKDATDSVPTGHALPAEKRAGVNQGADKYEAKSHKKMIEMGDWTPYGSACGMAFLQWPNPPTIRKKVVTPEPGISNREGSGSLDDFDEILRRMRQARPQRGRPKPALETVEEVIPPPSTWRGLTPTAAYLARYTELYGPCSDPPFTLKLSRAYYEALIREQQQLIKSEADVNAFLAGIGSLPNLKRIRITSYTYRPDYLWSSYPTPLIRSFPYGFRMPYVSWSYFPFTLREWDVRDHMFGLRRGFFAVIQALRTSQSLLANLESLTIDNNPKYPVEMECPTDRNVRATLNVTKGCPMIIPQPRSYVGRGIRKIDLETWLRLAFPGSLTPKLVISSPPHTAALEGYP